MAVAAVHASHLALRIGQAGIDPAAKRFAGRAGNHGGGVVGGQGVMRGLKVLLRQSAKVLCHSGAGGDGQRQNGGRSGGDHSVHGVSCGL